MSTPTSVEKPEWQIAMTKENGWMGHGADSDDELLHKIAGGDRQSLVEIYERYRQPLFRFLLQLTPDTGLAEEILQDTLVAVWRSASTYAQRSLVRTWLFGVARNQAHNALRQHRFITTDLDVADALVPSTSDPLDIVIARASYEALADAINQLGFIYREVLALLLIEEMSTPEIAAVLQIPVGTVKSRLRLARAALRTQLLSNIEEVMP
jgi:RNA polymerase sigma factor (sigma-70 family)